MTVLIIAEIGSCADADLGKFKRAIHAVKQCGADVFKAQWTSDPALMAKRRNAPEYEAIYRKYINWPVEWHGILKAECDAVGVEYMCTTYLPQDIPTVAPYVRRFKVASFEAGDSEFIEAHPRDREVIVSCGMGVDPNDVLPCMALLCTSSYPCPPEQAGLGRMARLTRSALHYDGLSDHTTSTLTGAVAVGAGATILEKHVRLSDTDTANPDYATALVCDGRQVFVGDRPGDIHTVESPFGQYVANVREAERMMGTGEPGAMPCEDKMMRYRVRP